MAKTKVEAATDAARPVLIRTQTCCSPHPQPLTPPPIPLIPPELPDHAPPPILPPSQQGAHHGHPEPTASGQHLKKWRKHGSAINDSRNSRRAAV
jgi:hypothetical protein